MKRLHESIAIDPALVEQVRTSPRDFPEVVIMIADQILPSDMSFDERIFVMSSIRDQLKGMVAEANLSQAINMTANVDQPRSPYFVQ